MNKIDKLIINSPFEEPKHYWYYDNKSQKFSKEAGRRPAGYVIASESKSRNDMGKFVEIPLVNEIRPIIKTWKENGYSGISSISKKLLAHWNDVSVRKDSNVQFFFCQLEAIETLIWITESQSDQADAIRSKLKGDGGDFTRICSKMATGSGKTIIMAMIIAWQVLNKVSDSSSKNHSKNILLLAPNLTVRSRLAVLEPTHPKNYYDLFRIVPPELLEKLRLGNIKILNWHALAWDTEEKILKRKSVDKRGAKSDKAYAKEVLGEMAKAKDILVINDEAHHAWRMNPELKEKKIDKDQVAESTIWVGGLDRLHRSVGILKCFDLSATPFAPSGKKSDEEALFSWIVSDFGLNDAIECGLVKTPRVVVRDDGKDKKDYKSLLYHIYDNQEIREDLSQKREESDPLPNLVVQAYELLGIDWLKTKEDWAKNNSPVPPVMITIANRTETSARVEYAFRNKMFKFDLDDLCHPDKVLRIDSKILEATDKILEEGGTKQTTTSSEESDEDTDESKLSKKDQSLVIREKIDSIGQIGKAGEQIVNIISVAMLTEGWDAKNVTQIMGLRAFSSQLLCEQVIGRGLRRMSYDVDDDGLFTAEYVNVFGVPFAFLPHEESEDGEGKSTSASKKVGNIAPDPEKAEHEISWPNILRVSSSLKPVLTVNWKDVATLTLNPFDVITNAELAAMIDGKPNLSLVTEIDLQRVIDKYRIQTMIFKIGKNIFDSEKKRWKGNPDYLLSQIIKLTEEFLSSDKIKINSEVYSRDENKRKLILIVNMDKIIRHLMQVIKEENTTEYELVFDDQKPMRSTADLWSYNTTRTCENYSKTHINLTVYDSQWEQFAAQRLQKNKNVISFVKNDHLNFFIPYQFNGASRKYYLDFIIKLKSGEMLLLEIKGQRTEESDEKAKAALDWVKAVNSQASFGKWRYAVAYQREEIDDILESGLWDGGES
ncbi:MAG: DEAD/DEAH box helicase family protein [Leptospiraceae bacterium]|nr:DEAD/DEAH box helicase family protein [Leptospiraceae bacterium]